MIQTAIIFEDGFEGLQFYVVPEDWTRFDGVYLSSGMDNDLEQEFGLALWTEDWTEKKYKPVLRETFCQAIKDGAILIVCGQVA
jgi:hypothetical protein